MQAIKTKKVRRGVVYTPDDVAASICHLLLKGKKTVKSVLEPSAGDGVFIKCLSELGVEYNQITAVDISKVSTKKLANDFPNIHTSTSDFIDFSLRRGRDKFDLILGNPPYVRRHNFTIQQTKSIQALSEEHNYPRAELKNAWAAFVVSACQLLSKNGRLAFIIPYEFLTVSYGKHLQNWILSDVGSLDVYIPNSKAFPEIDQDAVLLVVTKNRKKERSLSLKKVKSLAELSNIQASTTDVLGDRICSVTQNKFLIGEEATSLLLTLKERLLSISDICESATGTVTAANNYFILSNTEVTKHNLSDWASPILKKASYLRNSIRFTRSDLEKLQTNEPCYLINFGNKDFQELPESAQRYILLGERDNIHQRYKCRNREPWYKIPETPSAEGYFFKRSHLVPRLVINDADLQVTDTAYRLSVRPNHSIEGLCFSFYNSLSLLFAEIYGRFYGGGVLELTPNEFKKIPICYVQPSKTELSQFEAALSDLLNNPKNIFEFGDHWMRERMQLSVEQVSLVQQSLMVIRNHRLRHGAGAH